MGITLQTHKKLWGRSGNRCAFTDCRKELIQDVAHATATSVLGEECHIVAAEDEGPRGDPAMPMEARDDYQNLILLCLDHHKVIDDHPELFPAENLRRAKADHEAWIAARAGFDIEKQKDDEFYASVVDRWAEMCDLEHWNAWSSYVLGHDDPRLWVDIDARLEELREWLLALNLPRRYKKLNRSLYNFRVVLSDFQETFRSHADKNGDMLCTEKFYKIEEWNEEKYKRLLGTYMEHITLVQDLMYELTRAANLIIARAQKAFAPDFRRLEGMALVTTGLNMELKWRTLRLRYAANEQKAEPLPYPGLSAFKAVRYTRDYFCGPRPDGEDAP